MPTLASVIGDLRAARPHFDAATNAIFRNNVAVGLPSVEKMWAAIATACADLEAIEKEQRK